MDEKIEQILSQLELDEAFDEQVNLRNMIGNLVGRDIVRFYVEQYYNDKIAGRNPKLNPILLVGDKNSSIHVFARSIHNSHGNGSCHIVSGRWLSEGAININQFLYEGSDTSSYYICDGDKLNSLCQRQLYSILSTKQISHFDYERKSWHKKPFDRLVIVGLENADKLDIPLLMQFPIKVNLLKMTVDEVELALKQRLALLGWQITSETLLTLIAQEAEDISTAMSILALSYRIMRSQNKEVLMKKHVQRAICLIDLNNWPKYK